MAKAQQATGKKNIFVPQGERMQDEALVNVPAPRLREFYSEKVVPALMKRFELKNPMQVPKLQKITINIGVGDATQDQKLLLNAVNELELITGQRPVIKQAKKAISNFKLRQGVPIGTMVTLRKTHMFEFLDRFINITSPRIRDFRGFTDKSFDGRGNYNLGIKEQIIFPELEVDKIDRINGMNITFVTSAPNDEQAKALLEEFGFPFKRKN
jgi:large subunit ribosomal protein L5